LFGVEIERFPLFSYSILPASKQKSYSKLAVVSKKRLIERVAGLLEKLPG